MVIRLKWDVVIPLRANIGRVKVEQSVLAVIYPDQVSKVLMTTSWLSSITILYDNTLEKGVLYDARTNSIVTVTTESAKLLAVMQQNKIAGVLSRDKETIIETKLQNAFLNVQK